MCKYVLWQYWHAVNLGQSWLRHVGYWHCTSSVGCVSNGVEHLSGLHYPGWTAHLDKYYSGYGVGELESSELGRGEKLYCLTGLLLVGKGALKEVRQWMLLTTCTSRTLEPRAIPVALSWDRSKPTQERHRVPWWPSSPILWYSSNSR